MQLIIDDNW